MIEINKGLPVPPDTRGMKRKYPFDKMEVGDSFFVPDKTSDCMSQCIAYAKKRLGFSFTRRTVDGGVRVWRIS